jgi:2,3-bisphosphoglycerate-independent phosphoglycerate mutase
MAETEKIAMVSYYFNGQNETAFRGEKRIYVDSPKVSTYDQVPAMSTEKLVEQFSLHFESEKYSLSVINIACPDMVAHTGQLNKTVEAIRAADRALTRLIELAKKTDSYLVITADHGNAEELINQKTGQVDTEHSASKVPLIIYHQSDNGFKLKNGKLGDVAPTILHLLGLEKPIEMSGSNLIV